MTISEPIRVQLISLGIERVHRAVEDAEKTHRVILGVRFRVNDLDVDFGAGWPAVEVVHVDSGAFERVELGYSYGGIVESIEQLLSRIKGGPADGSTKEAD